MKKTIVTIADTHALHKDVEIPDGDILLCGGDFTNVGKLKDVESFNEFIGQFSHEHKVTIAGNHDFCFEKMRQRSKDLLTNCTYLHDSEIEIDGIKIYGSPWQPEFFDWAFNLKRGKELEEKWANPEYKKYVSEKISKARKGKKLKKETFCFTFSPFYLLVFSFGKYCSITLTNCLAQNCFLTQNKK